MKHKKPMGNVACPKTLPGPVRGSTSAPVRFPKKRGAPIATVKQY